MGTRIGCVASEKGAAEKERCDVGGGLGLRMQTTTNDSLFTPPKKMMMYTPHHDHHHDDDNRDHGGDDEPPTLLTATGGGFGEEHGCQGGDSRSGPFLCNNTSNTNTNHNQIFVTSMSDIYDVVGGGGGGGGAAAAAAADSGSFVMPLPPKSLLFSSSDSLMSHNYSGIVVPFTAAQRQELERQTLIYKYMMASVPVPPQLLIPISKTTKNFPHFHSTRSKAGGSLEMGVSSSTDLEPWRCRRTDGKKWRCSRNVVPDQKYCERHSHKSRPRSRKPVEQQQQQHQHQHQQQLHSHFFNHNNTDTNTNNINTSLLAYPKSSSFLDQREKHQSPYSSSSTTTTTTSHDQTRGLEWFMMKGEEANSNQAEWHQVVHVKPPPQQGQGQERAFGFYGQYQELQISQGLSDRFGSLIDPKLVPNQTRHIIDAWSMAERDHIGGEIGHHNNKYDVVSSNDKVLYSSLSLSMQGGNGNGDGSEESENSHMGFGIEGDLKRQWLNNNNNNLGSWNVGSSSSTSPPPGGPLAEALCLGMAGSTRLTTSPRSSS